MIAAALQPGTTLLATRDPPATGGTGKRLTVLTAVEN